MTSRLPGTVLPPAGAWDLPSWESTMPKKQSTAAKRARAAARQGEKYTTALRAEEATDPQGEPRPPRIYPTTSSPCPVGCDGTAHPNAVCWLWRPEDSKNVRHEVRRAAQLPNGRAEEVLRRYEPTPTYPNGAYFDREATWLLALVYAMLTDQHPELHPDRAELRAAVEADDPGTVDARMDPLDRMAARLMTKVPAVWWGEVKPRIDAYADTVESDDRELCTWQEIDARHVVGRLVDQWRKAWVPVRNHNGYMDPPGVMWLAPKGWLDELLVDRHGGYGPGARVRLTDGRPALVYAVEWGEDGPPIAYRVRELVPGQHGNAGRLVPSLHSDELVAAADCQGCDEA